MIENAVPVCLVMSWTLRSRSLDAAIIHLMYNSKDTDYWPSRLSMSLQRLQS